MNHWLSELKTSIQQPRPTGVVRAGSNKQPATSSKQQETKKNQTK